MKTERRKKREFKKKEEKKEERSEEGKVGIGRVDTINVPKGVYTNKYSA